MFPGKSVLYLSDKILCVCVLKTVIQSSVPPPLLAKKKKICIKNVFLNLTINRFLLINCV